MLLKTFTPLLGLGLVAAHPHGDHSQKPLRLWQKESKNLNNAIKDNEHAVHDIEEFDEKISTFFHAPAFERKFATLNAEQKALFKQLKLQGMKPLKQAKKQYARLANTIQQFDDKVDEIADVLGDEFKEMFDIQEEPCDANPCQNQGKCIDAAHVEDWQDPDCLYMCRCEPGWEGKNCEINVDECAVHESLGQGPPCLNGGECLDGINEYGCLCPPGFDGTLCEINIDDCVENQCANDSTCIDGVESYSCLCPLGFEGELCQVNTDDCESANCGNGSCVDLVNDYSCTCDAGFEGEHCEFNIDDCAAHQCENGAVCVDGINDYSCNCAAGFSGEFCDTNINDCLGNGCLNGATCVDGIESYTCSCAAGFTGSLCETNIDDCAGHNCLNGAACVDGINSYTCSCPTGFSGSYCETNNDDCYYGACYNGGTCVDGINSYTCSCPAGFSGSYCETNNDDCYYGACYNGGTCIDGINSYSCSCPSGYSGTYCETNNDDCYYNACYNGGTCIDGVNTYTCSCPSGYEGYYCETASIQKLQLYNPRSGDGSYYQECDSWWPYNCYNNAPSFTIDGVIAHSDTDGFFHMGAGSEDRRFIVETYSTSVYVETIVVYPRQNGWFDMYDEMTVSIDGNYCYAQSATDAWSVEYYKESGIYYHCGFYGEFITLDFSNENQSQLAEIEAYGRQ